MLFVVLKETTATTHRQTNQTTTHRQTNQTTNT